MSAALDPACAASPCPADLTGDQTVDVQDLVGVIAAWGRCPSGCAADVDENGIVDVHDLVEVIVGWGPCLERGTFPEMWISGGPDCGSEPSIQVHQYNENLYILRQSLCTNFEGPFIYLLFGSRRVLMQDTGAGGILIAPTVYGIIDDWLLQHGRDSIELVVTHSHAHGDHAAGDTQFVGQPDTTVVGLSASAVAQFFGIDDWPDQIVQYDLGERVVDVIPIPGHQAAHIALYDRQTGLLLTGDTLYPGRLYIGDFPQYLASVERMVDFTRDRPLLWILGTHIEMSNTPGEDFAFGSTHHPDEHPLALERMHLLELLDAVLGMKASPHLEVHDAFIVWPF